MLESSMFIVIVEHFSILADSPCTIMISATGYHIEGGYKDTVQNILDQKNL